MFKWITPLNFIEILLCDLIKYFCYSSDSTLLPFLAIPIKISLCFYSGNRMDQPRVGATGETMIGSLPSEKRTPKKSKMESCRHRSWTTARWRGERSYQPYTDRCRASVSLAVGALGGSVLKINKHLQDMRKGSTENAFVLGPEMCGSFLCTISKCYYSDRFYNKHIF